jgi:hypothetical protein
MQWFATVTDTLLTGAQSTKVFGGLGYRIGEETEHNSTGRLIANGDVKETECFLRGHLIKLANDPFYNSDRLFTSGIVPVSGVRWTFRR